MIKNALFIISILLSLKMLAMNNFNFYEIPLYDGQQFALNFVDESWLKEIEDPDNSNISTFYDGYVGKPPKVTPHKCRLYDGMAKKATLENNGFEFVDLRPYSDDFVKILTQLNEAIISNDGKALPELKKLYISSLKNAVATWWRENRAESGKNVEWLPFYESCGDLRTSEENESPNNILPPVKMVHVDYCSRKESLRYFSSLHEDMIKLRENQRVLRDVNIWAPTVEFCGGTPLAVADVASLDENNDLVKMKNVLPDSTYFIGFGMPYRSHAKFYTLKNWPRGVVVFFDTERTPHSAFEDGTGQRRNSIEVRGPFVENL